MYINIGTELLIKDNDILGIFDLDNTTVSKSTREYINNSEKNGECITISIEELPKSFIVTTKNDKKEIYISPLNTSTIFKRIKWKCQFIDGGKKWANRLKIKLKKRLWIRL